MSNIGLVTAVLIVAVTALVIWGINSDATVLVTKDLFPAQFAGAN